MYSADIQEKINDAEEFLEEEKLYAALFPLNDFITEQGTPLYAVTCEHSSNPYDFFKQQTKLLLKLGYMGGAIFMITTSWLPYHTVVSDIAEISDEFIDSFLKEVLG